MDVVVVVVVVVGVCAFGTRAVQKALECLDGTRAQWRACCSKGPVMLERHALPIARVRALSLDIHGYP